MMHYKLGWIILLTAVGLSLSFESPAKVEGKITAYSMITRDGRS